MQYRQDSTPEPPTPTDHEIRLVSGKEWRERAESAEAENKALRANHSTGPLWEVAFAIVGDSSSGDLVELLSAYGEGDPAPFMTTYPRQLHRIRKLLRAALEAEDPPISAHRPPEKRAS